MLLCFVVKNSYLIQDHHRQSATTDSLRISANNNSLKHPSLQSRQSSKWQEAISFLCKEWVHWRSVPSRRLWQSIKTGRRWGRCSIYRHPSPTPPTPPTIISSPYWSEAYQRRPLITVLSSTVCIFKPRGKVQMWVNFHFMLVYSPACSTCLFSWYGLLITVGGVGGDFSQTPPNGLSLALSVGVIS